MRLCVVSAKECWQREDGLWVTDGGFPFQMAAIGSLFDEVDMVIIGGENRPYGAPLPAGARVFPLRKPHGVDTRRKLSILGSWRYYLTFIARHVREADAVHVPVPGDIALLGMVVGLVFRKPVIARYGGSWQTNTLMNRVTRSLMRLFGGGHNVMLACGEGPVPPAGKVHWLFGTALRQEELDAIHPNLDRGLSDPPRLLYAGRLSEEKGVQDLITAVALLRKSGYSPLPTVTLLGDGPQRPSLERLCSALGCDDLIQFAGYVDRANIGPYFHDADFAVQPSLTESMGKVWIDAMAYGLPVLSSDVGSARVTIGLRNERGWLAPAGDPQALADTIKSALQASVDWRGLRRRCRAYVESRTLEHWTNQIATRCAARWRRVLVQGRLA